MRIALLIALVAVACGAGGTPNRTPDITGQITSVSGTATGVSILVEENPLDRSAGAKATVAVDRSARVVRRAADAGEVEAALTELLPGLRVSVWFDGPVAMSYPVQGKAHTVMIVSTR